MKKKKLLLLAGSILLILTLALSVSIPACAPAPAPAPAPSPTPAPAPTPSPIGPEEVLPSYVLKYQTGGVGDLPNNVASLRFMELVGEYSKGRITFEVFEGNVLADSYKMSELIMRDVFHISNASGSSEHDVRWNTLSVGGLVTTWDKARALLYPGSPMYDLWDEIGEDHNFKLIGGLLPTGFGGITLREGYRVEKLPEDAEGIKVRVPPLKNFEERFKALGFLTVPMPWAECYVGLQTGLIDGKTCTPAPEAWEMYRDVTAYFLYTKDYFEAMSSPIANRDWYYSLPLEDQEIFERAQTVTLKEWWPTAQQNEEYYLEKLEDYGIEVIGFTPEEYDSLERLIREGEWPVIEELVGKDYFDRMKAIVG